MKFLLIKEYILFAKGIIRKSAISSEASIYYRRNVQRLLCRVQAYSKCQAPIYNIG